MTKVMLLAVTLLLGVSAWGQCGLTDTSAHAPSNYTTEAKPTLNTTYVDTTFGCSMKRMVALAGQEYSEPSGISQNNTYFLATYWTASGPESSVTVFKKADGSVQCSSAQTHFTTAAGNEARWSVTNENIIYYHGNNVIYTYDVSTCAAGVPYDTISVGGINAIDFCGAEHDGPGNHAGGDYLCLRTSTTGLSGLKGNVRLYKISTKTLYPIVNGYTPFGSGEIDYAKVTPINTNLVVVGGNWGADASHAGMQLFNGITGAWIQQVAAFDHHSDMGIDTDATTEIIVTTAATVVAPCTKSNALIKIAFNATPPVVTPLLCIYDYYPSAFNPDIDFHISYHNANPNGAPNYYALMDALTYSPNEQISGLPTWTIDAVAKTATYNNGSVGTTGTNWWLQFHGWNNTTDNDAFPIASRVGQVFTLTDTNNLLVSGTAKVQWAIGLPTSYCSPSIYPLCTNISSAWLPYAGEVLRVKVDGTDTRRVAHHRAMVGGASGQGHYYSSPKGSVSRDGSLYLFNSNWGKPVTWYDSCLGCSGVDVYLLDPITGGGVPVPTSIAFGTQETNTTSASQTVTFTNYEATTITFSSAWTNTVPPWTTGTQFAVSSTTCGATLASGASCTINYTFHPTTDGAKTDTFTITSNASNSPQAITFSGTGSTSNPAPTASLSCDVSFVQLGNSFTCTPTTANATSCSYNTAVGGSVTSLPNCSSAFLVTQGIGSYSITLSATGLGGTTAATPVNVYVQQRVAGSSVF